MVPSDQRLSRLPEVVIDPDAFNAFEAAGWQSKASTYDRIAAITSRVIEPLLDAACVGGCEGWTSGADLAMQLSRRPSEGRPW